MKQLVYDLLREEFQEIHMNALKQKAVYATAYSEGALRVIQLLEKAEHGHERKLVKEDVRHGVT